MTNTLENTNISRDSVFDRVSRDNVFGLIKSKFIRPEGIEAHLKKLLHYSEEGHIGSRCYDTFLEELYVKLVKLHPEITQNFEEKIFPSVSFQEFLKEIIDNEESVSGMPKETVTLAIKVFTVLANVQRTFYYEHERKYLEEEKQDIWKGVSKTYAYFQYSNEEQGGTA